MVGWSVTVQWLMFWTTMILDPRKHGGGKLVMKGPSFCTRRLMWFQHRLFLGGWPKCLQGTMAPFQAVPMETEPSGSHRGSVMKMPLTGLVQEANFSMWICGHFSGQQINIHDVNEDVNEMKMFKFKLMLMKMLMKWRCRVLVIICHICTYLSILYCKYWQLSLS